MFKHRRKVRMYPPKEDSNQKEQRTGLEVKKGRSMKKLDDNERQRCLKIRQVKNYYQKQFNIFCELAEHLEKRQAQYALNEFNDIWLTNIRDFMEYLCKREEEAINEKTSDH